MVHIAPQDLQLHYLARLVITAQQDHQLRIRVHPAVIALQAVLEPATILLALVVCIARPCQLSLLGVASASSAYLAQRRKLIVLLVATAL